MLRVPGHALVLIEAKFGSPNSTLAGKEDRFESVEDFSARYPAPEGAADPLARDWIEQQQLGTVLEQLCRNVAYATWLAEPREQPTVINLVRGEAEWSGNLPPPLMGVVSPSVRSAWFGGEARRRLPGEQDDEPEQGVPAVAAVTRQLYPVRTWPLVSRTTPAFHQLRIVMGAVTKVALTGGRLVVAAPVSSAAAVRRAVVTWYRHHAAERLLERAAIWAKKMGVPLPLVLIRDQRRRWGSCDPKDNLRFNWRIVQAPMRLVEYVVAHELVHLGHRKHTTAFWAALGRVMPDYEARRERLCQVRRRFEW
jgi:hypothetical protein